MHCDIDGDIDHLERPQLLHEYQQLAEELSMNSPAHKSR